MEPLTKKEKVVKYFLLTGKLDRAVQMVDSFITQMSVVIEPELAEKIQKKIKPIASKLAAEFQNEKINKYSLEFDDKTLDELIKFYSTEAGRKSIYIENLLSPAHDKGCNDLLKSCMDLFNSAVDEIDEEEVENIKKEFEKEDPVDHSDADGLLDKYSDL